MKVALAGLFVVVMAAFVLVPIGRISAQSADRVDFARDVQPIFRSNCFGCHSASLQSGNFRLDRRRDSMPNRVGANGARVVPGSSATSRLYQRVSGSEAGLQMPPTGALAPDEIRVIKAWIDQGADWPDELAGETPTPPRDPIATQLLEAIRRGDRRGVDRLLKTSPGVARAPGIAGITPLMYAALYRDIASARQLLDLGADPNARNDAGATALMWAVDSVEITRLLLDRGADPNVRSADGRTPLLLAAARSGASDVVTALLDGGAKVDADAVVSAAAQAGNAAVMRLLLARGAKADPPPGDLAMRTGCADCVDLLLQTAGRPALTRALEAAARYGNASGARMLLARGAEPTAAALRLAAASEHAPVDLVDALLERGVREEQALDLATRQGDTAVVAALRKAGLTATPRPSLDLTRPASRRSVREAIAVSLPRLQHADTVFLKTAGCISCHNNSLFQMTAAVATRKGFRIDAAAMREQMTRTRAYLESWRERQLQDIAIPGGIDTTAYILVGLAAAQYPPDAATDALARYVRRRQFADGGWRVASQRPPVESSDITVTALSLRALQAYAPTPQRTGYADAIAQGASWLATARPTTTEDYAYVLLGLGWAHGSPATIRRAAAALIALQRPDGAWSQLPTLPGDAYATGQALSALAQSGALTTTDPVYQKGVGFLLGSQLEDGSWYVRSRASPVQPYFDSDFPHGKDQFISAAATNWATMALAFAAR